MVNFEEGFQTAFGVLEGESNIEPMIELLSKEMPKIAGDNFNYIMLYFERILSEYTLNRDLWELYVGYTDDMCKSKDLRVSIYEKATKNCPSERSFWTGYMLEMEKNEEQGEKIQSTAIKAIEVAGDQVGMDFHFEILKHLCEY